MLVAWRPGPRPGSFGVYRFDPPTGAREKVFERPGVALGRRRSSSPRARRPTRARASCARTTPRASSTRSTSTSTTLGPELPEGSGEDGCGSSRACRRRPSGRPVRSGCSARCRSPTTARTRCSSRPTRRCSCSSSTRTASRCAPRPGCGCATTPHRAASGCHEDPERTPPNRLMKALRRRRRSSTRRRRSAGVSYETDVKPIVEARCLPCHGGGKPPRSTAARPRSASHPGEARRAARVAPAGPPTARPWDAEAGRGAAGRRPALRADGRRDPGVRRVDRPRRTAMRRIVFVTARSRPAAPVRAGPGRGRRGQAAGLHRGAPPRSGITFKRSFGDHELSNIVEGTGSGACVFDYDGDGKLDIYFPQGRWEKTVSDNRGRDLIGQLQNALYRNKGNFQFEDVTDEGRRRRPQLRLRLLGRRLRQRRPRRPARPDLQGPRALPQQRRRDVHRGDREGGARRPALGAERRLARLRPRRLPRPVRQRTTSSTTRASSARSTRPPATPARSATTASPARSTTTTATAPSPT